MKEKSLCLFAFFLPLEQLMLFLFGIDTELKPYRIFLFLTLGMVVFSENVSRTKITKELKLLIFIFLYGTIMALVRISIGNGEFSYLSNTSTHFFIGLIIFYLASNIGEDYKVLEKLGNYFLLGVIISSLFGLYYFVFFGQYRLNGLFNNPNHLAIAINLVTPLLIYKLLKFRKSNYIYIIIAFLSYIVFLTGSRAGVFTQIICLLFLIYQMRRNIINLFFILLAGIATFAFIATNFSMGLDLTDRFQESNLKTGSGRFDIAKAALNLGVDTGFSGVGIGQYRYYHLDYLESNAYDTVLNYKLSTHNLFLDLLVNFGIISFFIFLYILILNKRKIEQIKDSQSRKITFLLFFVILIVSYSQEMFTFPIFWLAMSFLALNRQNFVYLNNNLKFKDEQ